MLAVMTRDLSWGFLVLHVLVAHGWLVAATGPLRENPTDVFTTPGMTVVLRCAVDHPAGQPAYNVYWYRHNPSNAYLTKGTRVFHQTRTGTMWERLSVMGDTAAGEYFLQVMDVKMSDAGDYSCVYFEGDSYLGESRLAKITVYEPPDEGYPRCTIEPGGYLEPGQNVVLTCVSSGGNPKPRLDWMSWHEILPGRVEQDPESKSTYELRLMETDNGAVFTCIENTPATSKLGTCSVKPFHRPTNVTLQTIPIDIGEDAVFSCSGVAMPTVSNYTWTIGGMSSDAFTSASGERTAITGDRQVLRIVNVQLGDNGTVVSCHANNEINEEGVASAEVLITELLPAQPSGKKVSPRDRGNNPSVNAGIIVGSICFLILLVLIIIILVRKLVCLKKEEGKKTKTRQGEPDLETQEEETQPLQSEEEIPQPVVNIHTNPRPVTICLTPRDAIVEHIREAEEAGGQVVRPEEDGSRVKVIGRLSCAGMTVDVGDFAEMYSRPVKKVASQKQADVVPDPEPRSTKPKPKPKPALRPALKPPLKPKPKLLVLPKPGTPSPSKPVEEYKIDDSDDKDTEEEGAEAIYENTYRRPDITLNLGEERVPLRPQSSPKDGGQSELL